MRFNFKNTCRYIKQLLACSDKNCKELEEERRFKLCELAYGSGVESGTAGYLVKYKGEDVYFAATRILAALLTKLKCIAEKATGTYVCDVVIGVPCCFSDRSRQAVVDAAFIAGLKCLRTMNEHAAIALDYGMFRCNSFEAESPTRVIFVSIGKQVHMPDATVLTFLCFQGHGMTTVSVVEFLKGKLRILGVAYDKDLSGRAIDYSIMEHYASIFESTHKINLLENRKSFLK
jgi:heat shock 70kDa protein 4